MPGGHAQVNEPSVFVHFAVGWQLSVWSRHSSTSSHSCPSPFQPGSQAHALPAAQLACIPHGLQVAPPPAPPELALLPLSPPLPPPLPVLLELPPPLPVLALLDAAVVDVPVDSPPHPVNRTTPKTQGEKVKYRGILVRFDTTYSRLQNKAPTAPTSTFRGSVQPPERPSRA